MSAERAQAVLQACLNEGVLEFCVCTGSRNSDLVHGLLSATGVRLHAFFDERAAAFFALGRMRATRRPVAVVTTSGTAVAELLPACVESYYQAQPLILVTADRPARFRGSGAPQAIEQERMFSNYAVYVEFESTSTDLSWNRKQPLHLNVCLEEPGGKPDINLDAQDVPSLGLEELLKEDLAELESFLKGPGPLIVMAGCLEPYEITDSLHQFLATLGAPILADPTSGLVSTLGIRGVDFKRVLRLGGVPSSRAWRDLEQSPEIPVLSVSRRPFSGLARPSALIVGSPGALAVSSSHSSTVKTDSEIDTLIERFPNSEPDCLRQLSGQISDQATIFLGNSLPIREWGLAAVRHAKQQIFANRGANGIDGCLSTFFGHAYNQTGECWGVFGDLTTLYDLSAPAVLASMPNRAIRIVVVNNGGGRIFRLLPNFQELAPREEALTENHHGFDYKAWAHAWGMEYTRFEPGRDLPNRPIVIELRPDQAQSDAFWVAWNQDS